MTAPTLVAAAPMRTDTFPHQPWCAEHWEDDVVCWAPDLNLRIRRDENPSRGQITVMMTHNPEPNRRSANRSRNITIFVDSFPDGEDSTDFDPDEAEVAAHALLSMVALSRGETSAADWHRTTAEQMAAVLLARREAGVR